MSAELQCTKRFSYQYIECNDSFIAIDSKAAVLNLWMHIKFIVVVKLVMKKQ